MSTRSPFAVAAVQAAPVFLDREATIAKACALIETAAGAGARLIVFPEAFVPCYPDWVWLLPPRERKSLDQLYAELVDQAVAVPSDAVRRLCDAARAAEAWVVIGVSERNVEASGSSLFNTLLFIDSSGSLVARHRKLVPTSAERLVWAQGDGSTLVVHETPLGRLGGLICWENYMPLARHALYLQGEQIHVAATWDRGEPWLSTLRHIAKEGRMYVIGCAPALRRADIPDRYGWKSLYPEGREWVCPGDSAIVDPEGAFIAGPVREREEILHAVLEPDRMAGSRRLLDVAGHYGRPDLFQLTVRRDGAGDVATMATENASSPRRAVKRKAADQPRRRPARSSATRRSVRARTATRSARAAGRGRR